MTKYLYTCYAFDETIRDFHTVLTTANANELNLSQVEEGRFIEVKDINKNNYFKLTDGIMLETFLHSLEKNSAWKPEKCFAKDHINPSHYKNYFEDKQWLTVMSGIPTFKNPEAFIGALELQIRKYLDRRDRKGEGLEQLRKSRWYLDALINYIENNHVLNLDNLKKD